MPNRSMVHYHYTLTSSCRKKRKLRRAAGALDGGHVGLGWGPLAGLQGLGWKSRGAGGMAGGLEVGFGLDRGFRAYRSRPNKFPVKVENLKGKFASLDGLLDGAWRKGS